ncbi:unnamed protein product [Arabis nemorensis]|uniref:DUF3444 domain-containing protein n=1 Tax=Arabis nemorensis TaxID=586526 RepID=A0A565B265_9BRAS|nr:unnamed protein product [Arabis nemorensis]
MVDITINGAIETWIHETSSDPTPSNYIEAFSTNPPIVDIANWNSPRLNLLYKALKQGEIHLPLLHIKGYCFKFAAKYIQLPPIAVRASGLVVVTVGAELQSSPRLNSCDVNVGEKRKRNENGESCNAGNRGVVHSNTRGTSDEGDAERGQELVQSKNAETASPKFNDFNKLREDANFEVGQTWDLYDTMDGMPRLYAQIRKVSAPCFGLRITYLEPDPDDEKEIQWFEEDLPVSAGIFRLGKSYNIKDCSIFSHVIHCNEGSNAGHFTVSPRKGETWALFKNWDINWSSEPDSHRKYEYEFVEILSDYTDGAGVSVSFLHKAKGFASVFFRVGTEDADISQIPSHSLYRFSHRIPSFEMSGKEGKGLPKDAYELDQAALPETIKEITVPLYLLVDPTASKSKPEVLDFPSKGKVFQTGQIWSFYSGNDKLPLYYCMIQKITLIQAFEQEPVFKLHVGRLKATPFPENIIQWEDKKMPVGCGTFLVKKSFEILTADDVSLQIVPQTIMDGNEYTILPGTGEVWAIYRF